MSTENGLNANLCDALTAGNHSDCNVPAGPITLKICRTLKPSHFLKVGIQFQTELVNGDGGIIYCQARKFLVSFTSTA
ncbi:hypothetical protein BG015_004778, partial [Linnemannia schmuckeri]